MISRDIGGRCLVCKELQMPSYVDFSGRPFHFIGIGGIGMSALAYILALRKLPVYGSDLKPSHITDRLQAIGAHIFWHQQASNFDIYHTPDSKCADGDQQNKESQITPQNLPQVVCSTAIQTANSEYQKALSLGCPILHRSDLLAALITQYESMAIAGTHGKTTTSSAIGHLLFKANLDPTIIVGGEVNTWGGNARLGQGKYLVAEADESDGSLIKFAPKIGVITNIESPGSLSIIRRSNQYI
jgi:UDP-N-acetylmuramate--alanine ligase